MTPALIPGREGLQSKMCVNNYIYIYIETNDPNPASQPTNQPANQPDQPASQPTNQPANPPPPPPPSRPDHGEGECVPSKYFMRAGGSVTYARGLSKSVCFHDDFFFFKSLEFSRCKRLFLSLNFNFTSRKH